MSEVIRVRGLSKKYNLYEKPIDRMKEALSISSKNYHREFYALKDVSFSVHKGETVGIIGCNGSGKSTILKIITGVLNATSGEIDIRGRISALLELGAGFNPEYTGIENVYLNGTMIGMKKEEIDEKLQDILEFADIGDFVYQPCKTYSSGMFVKLAFAVAINIDPEILIVDEALSVGDVFFQAKCFRKFESFKEKGKTILFVSHDLGSVSKYCDRVIVMHKGRVIQEGPPKEMIDLYKQILVDQYDSDKPAVSSVPAIQTAVIPAECWKDRMELNEKVLTYGDNSAEIVDFAIVDSRGRITNTIEKGETFEVRMKIKFNRHIADPIFAFTFKNLMGTEICGTNTMYEKVNVVGKQAGEIQAVSFSQKMDLNGGQYLLSLGCTGYEQNDFVVYHRLYDACSVVVVSDKNTVGFYDMNSRVRLLD